MSATYGLGLGTWQTLMTTELNSLAGTTAVLQNTGTNAAFDNTAALGTGLWLWGDFELNVAFGSAPAANATVDLYLIPLGSAGGSTYWDSSLTALPVNLYVGSFPCRAVTTAQVVGFRGVPLPPQKFIVLAYNGTAQTFPSSGSTVKMFPYGLSS